MTSTLLEAKRQALVRKYGNHITALILGHLPIKEAPTALSLKRIAFFPRLNLAFTRVQKNANSFTVGILATMEERSGAGFRETLAMDVDTDATEIHAAKMK